MADRSNELRRFLTGARARLSPERVGLGTARRRRVPGLRREEVAELAAISETWYARFESGRAVLSLSALERVAAALLLSREERIQLMVLARPDVQNLTAAQLSDSFSGTASVVTGLRDYARACSVASSFEELAQFAVRAVHLTCGDRSAGFLQQYLAVSSEFPFVAACGNGSETFVGYRQRCDAVPHVLPAILDGRPACEADLHRSPSAELRGRADRGFHAYYGQPILGSSGVHSFVGAAFVERHLADVVQVRAVEVVAAISELTLRSSR